ncbi:MAG: hypothetical protein ABJ387_03165 [Balneola sp.]
MNRPYMEYAMATLNVYRNPGSFFVSCSLLASWDTIDIPRIVQTVNLADLLGF